MALDISVDGFNPDGSPHLVIVSDGHVVMTGPITGQVTTSDGTLYDVTDPFIEVASEEHALQISDAIGAMHVSAGHPDFVNDPTKDSFGFVHVDSAGVEHVSDLATSDPIPTDATPSEG